MIVYVLTEEYNAYDQYGEYFLNVFKDKPTVEQLMELLGINKSGAEHVLKGGGRIKREDQWYILTEYDI